MSRRASPGRGSLVANHIRAHGGQQDSASYICRFAYATMLRMQNPATPASCRLAPFRRTLLRWYRANQRDLPWRRGRDPYRIWLAEIMLQQTRIAAVLPYYERFLARFPNVRDLARARESEVLKYWAGLGYYSRARNLHRAAKQIVAEHNARFPKTADSALALPGIGNYTAAAILSIAFDVPLAALDGNVARVLARLFAIRGDLRAPKSWKRLATTAQQLLPHESASDWNQALMELGETICTPRTPQCAHCPVARHCKAHALGLADKLPVARRKRETARVRIAAAIFLDPRGRTLLTKTPGAHDSALFSRLWQFPAVAVNSQNGNAATELSAHLQSSFHLTPFPLLALPAASHTVTYRRLALLPFLARVEELPVAPACRAVALENMSSLAVSSATRKIARSARTALSHGSP
jgi:A/G-specific adenine glycosylase